MVVRSQDLPAVTIAWGFPPSATSYPVLPLPRQSQRPLVGDEPTSAKGAVRNHAGATQIFIMLKLTGREACVVPSANDSDFHEMSCQTGNPFCFRRLLSNADAGTKRRSKLIWRAIFPAA